MDSYRSGVVALIGPPNAGKSTLLNQLIGEKVAIVSPKPQTTRTQITGILTEPERQVLFIDTPGIHQLRGKMNRFLVDAAWNSLSSAQVIVLVVDAALYAKKPNLLHKELRPIIAPLSKIDIPLYVAVNKIDSLGSKEAMLPLLQELKTALPQAELLPVSALKGEGAGYLLEQVCQQLPVAPPMFPEDQISTLPLRFMAAEIIREKLFLGLQKEIPYQVAVEIEKWEDTPKLTEIYAVIYVGRKSHKGIVIGKGGQNLKKIGRESRLDIAEILGNKVYLELWVRVKTGWTEDPLFLSSLGLTDGQL